MRYDLSLVTGPTAEPVTLGEVRAHTRIDTGADDGLVAGYLLAARKHVERMTGRVLMTQTWQAVYHDDWPEVLDPYTRSCVQAIPLPLGPVQSVSSVTYLDSAGASQTLSPSLYVLTGSGDRPWQVEQAYAAAWPGTRGGPATVTARFVAGYASMADVPEQLRLAIMLLTSHFYENREPVNVGNIVTPIPMTLDALIEPYRLHWVF